MPRGARRDAVLAGARAGRWLGTALFWLALAGCSALSAPRDPGAQGATAAAADEPPADEEPAALPAAPPSPSLEVVAPPALASLLARHLDVARVGRLAGDQPIDDVEWARLVAGSRAQTLELLATEGYFAARVDVAAVGARRVRVTVERGPRTRVEAVTLAASGPLGDAVRAGDPDARATLANWQVGWTLPRGRPFSSTAWADAKQAALARLRAAGYAKAQWRRTAADVDRNRARVALDLEIDSGPLYRFGSLRIDGLAVQDAQTVENLAALRAGTPLSESALLDAQERLQKSGLFDSATVVLDAGAPDPATAPVLVRLHEAPPRVYTFGVGVSANTGPRLSAEHVSRRVFGRRLSARNQLEWARKRQAWTGELSTHVAADLYRSFVGGEVERLETSSDTVLAQRLRLGRARELQRSERLYFVEAEASRRTTDLVRTDVRALSANLHEIRRELDSVLLPTRGYTLALESNVGHADGDAPGGFYSRLYGRLTAYAPLGRWFGQARVELGQVVKRSRVVVPDSQLFRAGGEDSVRGYAYRSLGPTVDGAVAGGAALATASVEIAHPIARSLPAVWWAAFVDAGRAADRFGDLDPALGYGLGVRWRSPVGPLRVDLAYGQEVHKLRLHFSVGIAF